MKKQISKQPDLSKVSFNEKIKSICAKSPLEKHYNSMIKRSPFDTGDKGIKR